MRTGTGKSNPINVPGGEVPLWMWEEWPVVSGEGRDAVILTYGELEREGVQIQRLREGCWFATITSNREKDGMEVATGWVEHQGVGATCVRLNRSWDNKYWVAPETHVMVIPNPFPEMDVDELEESVGIHVE